MQRLMAGLASLVFALVLVLPAPSDALTCPSFGRNLYKGLSGQDVAALQTFLTETYDYTYGQITGYYGSFTEAAVQSFQRNNGVVSSGTADTTGYGYVGPKTRGAIVARCLGNTPVPPPVNPNPPIPNPPPPVLGCSVGAIRMTVGQTMTFYQNAQVPYGAQCQSNVRTCLADGTVTGNIFYQQASCTPMQPVACSQDGVLLQPGDSRVFFKDRNLPFGASCQSIVRTCTGQGGSMSGDTAYQYSTCTVSNTPSSCTLDNKTISSGQSATYFKQKTVLPGQSCDPFAATRTCNNGTLEGNSEYQYATCTAQQAQSCKLDGQTIPSGSSREFYSREQVVYNAPSGCGPYTLRRYCDNGTLSGDTAYKYANCAPLPEKSCPLDNTTVAGGASRTFYSARSVASGQSCADIGRSRTCTNGTLSGSDTFKYSVCAPVGQRYCLAGGEYTAHGSSRTYYSVGSVGFGQQCSYFSLSRKCTDGTLSGSASYTHARCTEASGASCTLDGKTLNHGVSFTFYSTRAAPDCAEYAQNRTCYNGDLSGNNIFKFAACNTSTTTASAGSSQLASVLAAAADLIKRFFEVLSR